MAWLLLWLFLQLPAMLSSHWAVHELLIIQFVTASLLFPRLLRNAKSTAMLLVAALVMLVLAASRTGVAIDRCIGVTICLAIWLTVLMFAAKSPAKHQATLIAIASLLTAGGLLLWYIANEFGGNATVAHLSPLVLTLRLLG